jgi:translation initiation factor 2B subunit (eIF-2B alpha/beta/delta family)
MAGTIVSRAVAVRLDDLTDRLSAVYQQLYSRAKWPAKEKANLVSEIHSIIQELEMISERPIRTNMDHLHSERNVLALHQSVC